MHADLERLITLQRIDSSIHGAEHRLADEPARIKALDARLDEAQEQVSAAKERIAQNAPPAGTSTRTWFCTRGASRSSATRR